MSWLLPFKEWENPTESAAWRTGGCGASPFKDGFCPLRQIPGCSEPENVMLDYLHIYHIGYGLDAAASSITLLCYLGHFGEERKLDLRLGEAYRRFELWCKANKRTTSIDDFSRQSFGMGKCLGSRLGFLSLISSFHMHHYNRNKQVIVPSDRPVPYFHPPPTQPRQGNTFPTTLGGKAFDTGLVMAWLQEEIAAGSKARCPKRFVSFWSVEFPYGVMVFKW